MAAELITQILNAETAAGQAEEATKKKAEELIAYAGGKADELYERMISDANERAGAIISEANQKADEIINQAKNLAKLRKKSVINETVKRYDKAIEQIIDIACGRA